MNISKTKEMRASVDSVWTVLTDAAREQKYWTNIRNIKVISQKPNSIEREATVGPTGFAQKSHQTITLDAKRSIALTLTGDAITGDRTIILTRGEGEKTNVSVEWNLELQGVPTFVNSIVKNQISKVTEQALTKIAADAESAPRGKSA